MVKSCPNSPINFHKVPKVYQDFPISNPKYPNFSKFPFNPNADLKPEYFSHFQVTTFAQLSFDFLVCQMGHWCQQLL